MLAYEPYAANTLRRGQDFVWKNSRKIGNVNEGIVEGSEDAGDAEHKFACSSGQFSSLACN
jgi:hypothetical protein